MPGGFRSNQSYGVTRVIRSRPIVRGYVVGDNAYFEYPYAISGITKDSAGAALPSCNVELLRTVDDTVAGRATSDAAGAYLIHASSEIDHYAVAYKAGAPDVAGTTVNTLRGT